MKRWLVPVLGLWAVVATVVALVLAAAALVGEDGPEHLWAEDGGHGGLDEERACQA